jgi:hypothetical protein
MLVTFSLQEASMEEKKEDDFMFTVLDMSTFDNCTLYRYNC